MVINERPSSFQELHHYGVMLSIIEYTTQDVS